MAEFKPLFSVANGRAVEKLPTDSLFSDGVLETMRFDGGRVPLLPWHLARLRKYVHVDERELSKALQEADNFSRSRAGPLVWRLRAGRAGAGSQLDLSVSPLDSLPASLTVPGVRLYPCKTRFTWQDASDGRKALQRARYHAARSEFSACQDPYFDGILCDPSGFVIEGCRTNLLLYIDGKWCTPDLSEFGVRGVMLQWLTEQISVTPVRLMLADLMSSAQEVAVCNALRGVLPVSAIGSHGFDCGANTKALQSLIKQKLW
ncbi:aminotransferase class IV [Biformimicrobium ophioploci]|uniref:aminotransferase class IV n=1 Tax=Biformimicrobium ophioploci TaxID=3036711 RepID=UPI002555B86A|nr:aminotransferase class IV [Microbulbifer sp. NKW57]